MGNAYPVIPNTMWELSRRCTGRMFLLRPDREIVDAILYCFGYCAEQRGMALHQLTLMYNHYHCVATDRLGMRVEFTKDAHELIARCIKEMRGHDGTPMDGTVWEPSEQTGRVMLVSEEAFVEACAYAIANPVAAGLVHHTGEWTSFVSSQHDMASNRAITVKRPACLSDAYPETATLRFCLPPALGARRRELVEAIEGRAAEKQREARAKVRERGRRFTSRAELLAVDAFDSPKTRKREHGIVPAVRAARATVLRIAKKQLVAWRTAYRIAFERFRRGEREAEWPAGTWFYARYAGVRVAPDPLWTAFGAA